MACNDFGTWYAESKGKQTEDSTPILANSTEELKLATIHVLPSVFPNWLTQGLPSMPPHAAITKGADYKRLNKDYMQAFWGREYIRVKAQELIILLSLTGSNFEKCSLVSALSRSLHDL